MILKKCLKPLVYCLFFVVVACAPEDKQEDIPQENRDKYIGSWLCKENSKLYQQASYSVNIKKSLNNNQDFLCGNFYQLGATINTTLSLNGSSLIIPKQQVSGQSISGSGSIFNDNYITFNFTVFDGSQTDSVTAVLTR